MKAFDTTGSIIEVEVTGERTIYLDDEIFSCYYIDLPHEMQRYFDRVCDELYDLPFYEDGYITATFNRFTAKAPAKKID